MAKFSHIISAIDSHTEGHNTRIVLNGMPPIRGNTMAEKFVYIKNSLIHKQLREALMLEPRGYQAMFGAVLTPPCHPEADWGIIFMSGSNFMPGCGHGTIGTATMLTEMGFVEIEEPETTIVFDTAAGLVRAHVVIKDGKASEVWFENVPSFMYRGDVLVDVPGVGNITVDIAFGGNFYAIVAADQLGMTVELANMPQLLEKGLRIGEAVSEQVKIQHPVEKELNYCEIVYFIGPPSHPEAVPPNSARQMTAVRPHGLVGRCPCGTGTSARMAALYAKGKLKLGETIVHESLIGRFFYGQLLREASVGGLKAVIPRISGTAHITGIQQFVIDPDDPLKYGFSFENYS